MDRKSLLSLAEQPNLTSQGMSSYGLICLEEHVLSKDQQSVDTMRGRLDTMRADVMVVRMFSQPIDMIKGRNNIVYL